MVKPKWLSNLTQAKVESDAQGVEKRRQKRDEARGVVVTVTSWNHGHLSLSSGSQLIQLSYSLSCLGWLWSAGKFNAQVLMTRFGMGICSQQASGSGKSIANRWQGMSEPLLPGAFPALRQLSSPFQLLLHHVWQFLPWPLPCTSDLGAELWENFKTRHAPWFFFGNVNLAQGMWWFLLQDLWVRWVVSCSLSSMAQLCGC